MGGKSGQMFGSPQGYSPMRPPGEQKQLTGSTPPGGQMQMGYIPGESLGGQVNPADDSGLPRPSMGGNQNPYMAEIRPMGPSSGPQRPRLGGWRPPSGVDYQKYRPFGDKHQQMLEAFREVNGSGERSPYSNQMRESAAQWEQGVVQGDTQGQTSKYGRRY